MAFERFQFPIFAPELELRSNISHARCLSGGSGASGHSSWVFMCPIIVRTHLFHSFFSQHLWRYGFNDHYCVRAGLEAAITHFVWIESYQSDM